METIATTPEPKDERGIDILPGNYEAWNFVNTSNNFFAKFHRLVNIAGTHYAEIDYSEYANGPWAPRFVRLLEFTALRNCQEGDFLHCRWILRKPYVFAEQSCKRGHPLTQEEWDRISFTPGCRYPLEYPDLFGRFVEA